MEGDTNGEGQNSSEGGFVKILTGGGDPARHLGNPGWQERSGEKIEGG